MNLKTKYNPGDTVFLKNDYDQLEYIIVGVIGRYGPTTYLELQSPTGDLLEVHETSVTSEQDVVKKTTS